MIEESEALHRVAEHVVPSQTTRRVSLEDCLHGIAAADVYSRFPQPRFANSMVDGYALPGGPHPAGARFRLTGEQPAGCDRHLSLAPGEAVRIFTGAPLPAGTGAVAMQEDVVQDTDQHIIVQDAVEPGEGIRLAGDDLCEGQKILSEGQALDPQKAALLASQGETSVLLRQLPRVRILSTGDELHPPGQPLQPGELYESNGLMLALMGQACGWPGWTRTHVRDDPSALRQEIEAALTEGHDFILFSGGVSVGQHDHVRPVLQSLGFQEHFWRVRVQPGKPVLFGTLRNCHLFGLPGNPVSSFVSFHLFTVPAICLWLGLAPPSRIPALLQGPVENTGSRPHYLRGHWNATDRSFRPLGKQRSHGMLGLSQANALARIPPSVRLTAGDSVEILPL